MKFYRNVCQPLLSKIDDIYHLQFTNEETDASRSWAYKATELGSGKMDFCLGSSILVPWKLAIYVWVAWTNSSFIRTLFSHPRVRAGIYNDIFLVGSSAFGNRQQYLNRCATLKFLKCKLKPEVRLLSQDHMTWYPGLWSLSPLVQPVDQPSGWW